MSATISHAEGLETYGLMEPWEISDGELSEWACELCARAIADTEDLDEDGGGFTGYGWNIHPIWPYAESDTPATCAYCSVYLDTQLSRDGEEYLRENYAPELWGYWGVEA
jgi:hypothetical protein